MPRVIGRLDGTPATGSLNVVLLIFDKANVVHISCAYLFEIDTRMKINLGQIWCPEADYNSNYAWTLGLVKKRLSFS